MKNVAGRAKPIVIEIRALSLVPEKVLCHFLRWLNNVTELFEDMRLKHAGYTHLLIQPSKWPKPSSGKVLIPYLIRMIIKFSWAVAAIDQLILLLSILEMQNLARKGLGFGSESILIIISCSSKHIEKREDELQVTHTNRSRD